MNKDKKLIHSLLDGELLDEEREAFLQLVASDPEVKKEFIEIKSAVCIMENAERLSPTSSFITKVMKGLPAPEQKKSFMEKTRDFFLGRRVLQWNMATAIAMLLVFVSLSVFLNQSGQKIITADYKSTVRFIFYSPKAESVALASDFNNWKIDNIILKKQHNSFWVADVPLKPGTYNYMFVINGTTWTPDPHAGAYRDDGFGYKNSILRVVDL